jgi:hypothetical protein
MTPGTKYFICTFKPRMALSFDQLAILATNSADIVNNKVVFTAPNGEPVTYTLDGISWETGLVLLTRPEMEIEWQ